MRVLIFGDSITYGKVDTEGGWVGRLRKDFDREAANSNSLDFPNVYNQGVSGDTAEDILKRLDTEVKARLEKENIFIIAVGTNDSSLNNGTPLYSVEQFRINFEKIIQKMQDYSNKILVVGLLPVDEKLTTPIPWRPLRHYTNKQIRKFDEVIKELAYKEKLPYVSLFETFSKKLELFPDGLHPNDSGHQLIAELVKPELDKLVG